MLNTLGSATNSDAEVEEFEESDGAWSESSDDSDDDESLQTQIYFFYVFVQCVELIIVKSMFVIKKRRIFVSMQISFDANFAVKQ